MAIRFLAPKLSLAAALIALAACATTAPEADASRSAEEQELARQAQALQKTIIEGAVAGGFAGGLSFGIFGGDSDDVRTGVSIGTTLGAAAGTYVGFLQRRYRNDELRLERMRDDAERSNAETAAAIATMRAVLAQQNRELAAIRASGATAQSPELAREVGQAEDNLANMERAIEGAEARRDALSSTRSLELVEGEITGVDQEIAELSSRIQTMREIADTLAGAI